MKEKQFSFRSLRLSYYDSETRGKTGKTLLFAHANGYAAGCYRTYFEELKQDYRILAFDFSGHGNSESSLDFKSWFYFRDQILSFLDQVPGKNEPIIGIGHSFGGASLILASQLTKHNLEKVIAWDPVILGWKNTTLAKIFGNPLARGAKKRRKVFPSLGLVRRAFRNFPAFANWDSEIFEDYLRSCLRKQKDSENWELCCDPEVESKIFSLSSYRVVAKYRNIRTETHIVIPQKYEVCSPSQARQIIRKNKKSSLEIWPEATHFFPFEIPEKVKEYLRKVL
jgi:pimeloyl-ACP methyl ester carboxylesterase